MELALEDLRNADDNETLPIILGTIALAKGAVKLGAFIAQSDSSEIDEIVEDRLSWSELYRK